ncbi:MAG: hypothetical protein ACJAUQ_000604 [Maribacter sp.]|jgi:hypothetical protein
MMMNSRLKKVKPVLKGAREAEADTISSISFLLIFIIVQKFMSYLKENIHLLFEARTDIGHFDCLYIKIDYRIYVITMLLEKELALLFIRENIFPILLLMLLNYNNQ